MKTGTRLGSLLIGTALAVSMLPATALAAGGPAVSNNVGDAYGSREYPEVTSSYLAEVGGQLQRVECINGKVVIERYNGNYELMSDLSLDMELPIWGGYYRGLNSQYLIFGQENPNEDPNCEVIRVVKYDMNWVRQGHASLLGAQTKVPFYKGQVSAVEKDGYLYVHTARKVYDLIGSEQANLVFSVRLDDMSIASCSVDGDASDAHQSYNQHILVDVDGNLLTLIHGTDFPRGMRLTRYNDPASQGDFLGTGRSNGENVALRRWNGNNNEPRTGARVLDFDETNSTYLSLWYEGDASRPKNPGEISLTWLAKNNYLEDSDPVTKPIGDGYQGYVIPLGLDGGYIVYENADHGVSYTKYDEEYGNIGVYTSQTNNTARLSDCEPIVYNYNVVWYVTENSVPVFYTLNANGITSTKGTGTGGQIIAPSTSAFVDVPNDAWYADAVNKAASAGLLDGTGDGYFNPTGDLTLGAVLKLVAALDSKYTGRPIPDPEPGKPWYDRFYTYCSTKGLVDNYFYPYESMNNPATRLDMVAMMNLAIPADRSKIINPNAAPTDQLPYGTYPYGAEQAILTWYQAGILAGDQNGRFNGLSHVSRAEMATVLCRVDGLIPRIGTAG